jgi:hypothetical protein
MRVQDLAALQLSNGGFASVVTSPRGRIDDCNGFTAAIVLRLTRHLPPDPTVTRIRERALAYIATCVASSVPDAFAFWPDAARPRWAPSIPADVDDTAIMLTELVRYRWLDRHNAIARFSRAILPARVDPHGIQRLPSWIVPGCFYTWIGAATSCVGVNIVDCCVNVNVVALMAFIGAARFNGYAEAIETVHNAVHWSRRDKVRLSAITPFYPSVANLIDALEHAVECGATPLVDTLHQLRALGIETVHERTGCCRSAYGSAVWHCEAIDVARELAYGPASSTVIIGPAACAAM